MDNVEVDMRLAYLGPSKEITIPPVLRKSGAEVAEVVPKLGAIIRPWTAGDPALLAMKTGVDLRFVQPLIVVSKHYGYVQEHYMYVHMAKKKMMSYSSADAVIGGHYLNWVVACGWLASQFPKEAAGSSVSAIMQWFRDRQYTPEMFVGVFGLTVIADWWLHRSVQQLQIQPGKEIVHADW